MFFAKISMTNWVCFYEISNYNEAKILYNGLNKASEAFGLKIAEPEWVELED